MKLNGYCKGQEWQGFHCILNRSYKHWPKYAYFTWIIEISMRTENGIGQVT
uniref:Uncharacterized protein n=1 Tax=Anguilla anguilla TaxID=7936 RepID=A0A0E9PLP2_ANGAN